MQSASQMYDRASTVFSPDGRLFQVEYAREAVKRGTTAAGIKVNDGVVLLVDKRITSRLIEVESIEKIFQIDEHIGAATSGLVADARALIDKARVESQVNKIYYDEDIGVEVLAKKICDHKQLFTQYGGARPYGTSLLLAGVNGHKPRLFETDPSGALLEYKATSIGANKEIFTEVFEEGYQEDMSIKDAIFLAMKSLYRASEGKIDSLTIEIGIVTTKDTQFKKLTIEEVDEYVKESIKRFKDETNEDKKES